MSEAIVPQRDLAYTPNPAGRKLSAKFPQTFGTAGRPWGSLPAMIETVALLIGFVCALGSASADNATCANSRVARPAVGEPVRLAQVDDENGVSVPGAGDDLEEAVGPDIKKGGIGPNLEGGIGPDIKGGIGPDIKGDVGENVKDAIGPDLKGAIGENLPTPRGGGEGDDSDD